MSAPPVRGDMVAFRYRSHELIGVVRDFYVEHKDSPARPDWRVGTKFVQRYECAGNVLVLCDYRLRYVVELTDPLSNLTGQRVISRHQIVEHWTPDRDACD